MAKATFSIKKIEIPSEVARPLYAGVGATDLAVEYVRGTVVDVQKRVTTARRTVRDIDLKPKALREQAVTAVTSTLDETASSVNDTYTDLAKRGEALVGRIRQQESTQQATRSARTTKAKAKTVKTQGTSSAKKTSTSAKQGATSTRKSATATAKTAKSAAKRTATSAKKSSAPARSSAKGAATAAKATAENTAQAATEAAAKVGD